MFEGTALIVFCIYSLFWFLSFNNSDVRKFMFWSHGIILGIGLIWFLFYMP